VLLSILLLRFSLMPFLRFPLLVLIALVLFADAGRAQTVPASRSEVRLTFAPIVKKVTPAVVNVYGARIEKAPANPLLNDPVFRQFFGNQFPQQDRVRRSAGSGVIVEASGLIVTNHHVIEGMTEIRVSLADKREFAAEIVLRDPRSDLAVLRIKPDAPLQALELGDADRLEVGDFVIAIGNPFGVGQTVTQGIVSALARTLSGVGDYQFFIQTDAAINPGNSGGALVDIDGRLVGINSAIFSQSGGSHGIGFAIPVSMVRVVLASAKAGQTRVHRPWFGANVQPLTTELAESLGLDRPQGALVAGVYGFGPAHEAGIKQGDVITALDGVPVDDAEAFGFRFATKPIGGAVKLTLRRGKATQTLTLNLSPAPEHKPRQTLVVSGRWPIAGAKVMTMSPAVAEDLGIETLVDGVAIAEVEPDSPAAQIGLLAGDIILSIDNEPVTTTKELEALAKPRKYYWPLVIMRHGEQITSRIGG
jgi:Do/DeqQ family serine protease